MSPELQNLLLKAAYSGRKYQLAVQTSIDAISKGILDTPGNEGLATKYWHEWRTYNEQALELHQKEGA
jgi:hypothetical protein